MSDVKVKSSDTEKLVRGQISELIEYKKNTEDLKDCLLYTSQSPRD